MADIAASVLARLKKLSALSAALLSGRISTSVGEV